MSFVCWMMNRVMSFMDSPKYQEDSLEYLSHREKLEQRKVPKTPKDVELSFIEEKDLTAEITVSRKANPVGIDVQRACHAYPVFPFLPEARKTIRNAFQYIQQEVHNHE